MPNKKKALKAARKPDRLTFALQEHRMAQTRLDAAEARSHSAWEQFLSACRDSNSARADVKRSLDKLSRVCALEMKKSWKNQMPPKVLNCSTTARDCVKPVSITIPMFQEDPPDAA